MHNPRAERLTDPEFAHLFAWHIDEGVPAVALPGLPRRALTDATRPKGWEIFGLAGVPHADLARVIVALALFGFLLLAGDVMTNALYVVVQALTWVVMASAACGLLGTLTQRRRKSAFVRKWGHQVVFGPDYAEMLGELTHTALRRRAQAEGIDISDGLDVHYLAEEKRVVLSVALLHWEPATSPEELQQALDAVHDYRETRSAESVQVLHGLSEERLRRQGEQP